MPSLHARLHDLHGSDCCAISVNLPPSRGPARRSPINRRNVFASPGWDGAKATVSKSLANTRQHAAKAAIFTGVTTCLDYY